MFVLFKCIKQRKCSVQLQAVASCPIASLDFMVSFWRVIFKLVVLKSQQSNSKETTKSAYSKVLGGSANCKPPQKQIFGLT